MTHARRALAGASSARGSGPCTSSGCGRRRRSMFPFLTDRSHSDGRRRTEIAMTTAVDVLHPDRPKRVLVVASNPAVSAATGWPIGFWWAELSHPYWEFTEHGYRVDIASPDGGALRADAL